jgi:hypothetical protein
LAAARLESGDQEEYVEVQLRHLENGGQSEFQTDCLLHLGPEMRYPRMFTQHLLPKNMGAYSK